MHYCANARIIFAEMCKKKTDAMKERERTRTMNGSLLHPKEGGVSKCIIQDVVWQGAKYNGTE